MNKIGKFKYKVVFTPNYIIQLLYSPQTLRRTDMCTVLNLPHSFWNKQADTLQKCLTSIGEFKKFQIKCHVILGLHVIAG